MTDIKDNYKTKIEKEAVSNAKFEATSFSFHRPLTIDNSFLF